MSKLWLAKISHLRNGSYWLPEQEFRVSAANVIAAAGKAATLYKKSQPRGTRILHLSIKLELVKRS